MTRISLRFCFVRKVRKATITFVIFVCPSTWNNLAPTERIFMNLIFGHFSKSIEKIQILLKYDNNNWHFAWRQPDIFFIIFRYVFLRVRNVLGKSFRVKQNTHFVINYIFFFENHAVYEIMWKILWSCAGQRRQYGPSSSHAGYLRLQTHIQNM